MAINAGGYWRGRSVNTVRLLVSISCTLRRYSKLLKIVTQPCTAWIPPPYPAEVAQKRSRIETHLSLIGFPNLSTEQQAGLELPISTMELLTTARSLPEGKSSGPDCFTKAYYVKSFDWLQAPMCVFFFNSLATDGRFPQGHWVAHITVLPKEGKDPMHSQSYRPISLLNTDLKLFATILANRLKTPSP